MSNREQLFDELLASTTLEPVLALVGDCVQDAGFEHFIYSRYAGTDLVCSFANCREGLLRGYQHSHYERLDPVIAKVFGTLLPVEWSVEEYRDTAAEPVFQQTQEYGYQSGVSVPVRTPNSELDLLVVLSPLAQISNRTSVEKAELIGLAALCANQMNQCVEGRKDRVQITNRERECLQWTSKGKTAGEVSVILGISQATVQFHIQNAKRRLSVASKAEAVFKANQLGLLVDSD